MLVEMPAAEGPIDHSAILAAAAIETAAPIAVFDAQSAAEGVFLAELAAAERKFAGGYVGVSYFVNSWRSNLLDPGAELRQRLLTRLVDAGRVLIYDAPDGSKAMRRV